MGYYCDVCDKTLKIKSKSKHLTSLTQNELEGSVHSKHIVENPDFFDIDSTLNDYITNQNKKFDL